MSAGNNEAESVNKKATPAAVSAVIKSLSGEEDQERDNLDPKNSYLENADPAKLQKREREYTDREKHFVRSAYWLKVAKGLYKNKFEQTGKGLRYFTLPGSHRIDIELFHRAALLETETDEVGGIKTIGVAAFEVDPGKYGAIASRQPKLQLFGMCALEEALNNTANDYYDDLLRMFPFDIINFDLTTSLIPKNEGPYSETMKALDATLKRQSEYARPWALFLTFRNDVKEWEAAARTDLQTNLQKNLDKYPKVHEAFNRVYQKKNVAELSASSPSHCLSQATTKWIVDRAHSYGVKLKSVRTLYYNRYSEGVPPYPIYKDVLVFQKGDVGSLVVPTRGPAQQGWMEDNIVACIDGHKPVDIEKKLFDLSMSVGAILDNIDADIKSLIDPQAPCQQV